MWGYDMAWHSFLFSLFIFLNVFQLSFIGPVCAAAHAASACDIGLEYYPQRALDPNSISITR